MIALRRLVVLSCCLPTAALADAPPVPLAPVQTVCSTAAPHTCAVIDRRAGPTAVRGPAGRWRFPAAPPWMTLRADGRLVTEEYRAGGLLELSDTPATVLIVLRSPTGVVARVTLGDIARRPEDLERTASHRHWSDVIRFLPDGGLAIDLPDGRRLRVTATGRKWMEPGDGGLARIAGRQAGGR